MKKLLKVGNRPDNVQNAILRKHFLDLTQNFMIPLERLLNFFNLLYKIFYRHFLSLMPLQKHISPFKSLPQIKPFLFDEFLLTLSQTNSISNCGFKGDLKSTLYFNFFS